MSARRPPPLGQHFLHDRAVARRIVEALEPGDAAVLEIGPGRGILTENLAGRCRRLVAVEIDTGLVDALRANPALAGVEIVSGDILNRPLPDWIPGESEPFLLIGNLPYAITAPILFAYCAAAGRIERAVLMMQREVARRVTAPPGSRTYGVVSVASALVAERELLFTLGTGAFSPPPRVESAVVRFRRLAEPLSDRPGTPGFDRVMRVVRAAFSQRRKKLRNSLAAGLELREGTEQAIAAAGLDLDRRAETLSPGEFCTLAAVIEASGGV